MYSILQLDSCYVCIYFDELLPLSPQLTIHLPLQLLDWCLYYKLDMFHLFEMYALWQVLYTGFILEYIIES